MSHLSIGRRLSLLVLGELFTAAFVVAIASFALSALSERNRYMHQFVFAPLLEIEDALEEAITLRALIERPMPDASMLVHQAIGHLQAFSDRYDRDWKIVDSNLLDARRFRATLEQEKRTELLNDEREAVAALHVALQNLRHTTDLTGGTAPPEEPVQRSDVADLRAAMVRLLRVNLRYVEIGYEASEASTRTAMALFLVVGLLSIAAAPLFGLSVRRAIVPRIQRLVEQIKRFREGGTFEPGGDFGGDELAVLAHAIDVSFKAIAERDRERERFLAMAAHELKTPLTTMKGFAQALLVHPDDATLRDRALSIIDRQATRLARLSQDLLWSARAYGGVLPFRPAPLDLGALARRVIGEVEMVVKERRFHLEEHGDAHLLGDAALLEHSLWSLLTEAAMMTRPSAPVTVMIDAVLARVRLSVEARGAEWLPDDLDKLVEPFVVLQFEGHGDDLRGTGLGLHLVRQIARLHGATFRVMRKPEAGIVFELEFMR